MWGVEHREGEREVVENEEEEERSENVFYCSCDEPITAGRHETNTEHSPS